MSEGQSVPEKVVERNVIVYRTLVDPTVAKMTGEKMKTELFVRFGFLKPKPEEVRFMSVKKYYKPYVVVSGKYSIDYYRKRIYTIEVDEDVREVIILERTFTPEKGNKKGFKTFRLAGQERLSYEDEAYIVLDREGREVEPKQVPEAPSEEEPQKILAEFSEKTERLEMPIEMEVDMLRSKIVRRPESIERVVEELFEVSERAVIYTPIYEAKFRNEKTGKVKALNIDGVTAKIIS